MRYPWPITAIWYRGYETDNHSMMGWAVAMVDEVAAGRRDHYHEADIRSDLVRMASRRWLGVV